MTEHEWSFESTMRELGDNPRMSVWAHIWLLMLQRSVSWSAGLRE